MRGRHKGRDERGAALLEFTIGALVFLTAIFAVLEFGRLLWTHNALADAARRGARYAVNQDKSGASITAAQKMAVYGTTADGTGQKPRVMNLTTAQVKVNHSSNYNVGEGSVSVTIEGYEFKFVVPIVGTTIKMPTYRTTLTGENAGRIPPPVS